MRGGIPMTTETKMTKPISPWDLLKKKAEGMVLNHVLALLF
jgi:hypothetical protein